MLQVCFGLTGFVEFQAIAPDQQFMRDAGMVNGMRTISHFMVQLAQFEVDHHMVGLNLQDMIVGKTGLRRPILISVSFSKIQ